MWLKMEAADKGERLLISIRAVQKRPKLIVRQFYLRCHTTTEARWLYGTKMELSLLVGRSQVRLSSYLVMTCSYSAHDFIVPTFQPSWGDTPSISSLWWSEISLLLLSLWPLSSWSQTSNNDIHPVLWGIWRLQLKALSGCRLQPDQPHCMQ